MNWQQPIPRSYTQLPTDEVVARIAARKTQLADQLVILGHHYQQDNVIRFADITGDSFQLSREAAKLTHARYIVFCGVHFMAESADILTADHQQVLLPDLGAGCSMADMAQLDDVEDAWNTITDACRDLPNFQLIPITYMNSAASLKSFVGEHGGAVCTSSNCEKILAWALNANPQNRTRSVSEGQFPPIENRKSKIENRKIIFFPDQHLGRNTAYQMGFPLESMVVWDYKLPSGGLTESQIRHATFILWKGHCSVHQLFRPEHVDQARQKYPGVKVIVHPECRWEVVQKADMSGSTDFIGKTIAAAPPNTTWAIGTEVHMVNRLAHQHPDKKIVTLSECQCLCTTMYRIDPPHLLYILDNLAEGKVLNRITVDPHTKFWARVSLQRMLDITAGTKVSDPPGTPPEKHPPANLSITHISESAEGIQPPMNAGSRVGPEFDAAKLERIIGAYEGQGGTVIRGEAAASLLRNNGGNALYFPVKGGPGALILGSDATRLEVTEELMHMGQFRMRGWPSGEGLRNALEVEVQERLLNLAARQNWTPAETYKILNNQTFWLNEVGK